MLYAVKTGNGYWHGGNVREVLPAWGTVPFYALSRRAAVKHWTKSGAKNLIAKTHKAHLRGGKFVVDGPLDVVWRFFSNLKQKTFRQVRIITAKH